MWRLRISGSSLSTSSTSSGCAQRAVLKGKGLSPHYLVMTATPIPRTLALSFFADFDVTTINELPPGRQPIHTRWLRSSSAGEAYDFIREQVGTGRQAYIVLPQIDDTGLDDANLFSRNPIGSEKVRSAGFGWCAARPTPSRRKAADHESVSAPEKSPY